MSDLVAAAPPLKIVRVSNTTLFRLAADAYDDATLWTAIAEYNGLDSPWIESLTEVRIPDRGALQSNGGVLGA